jgi:hypothetical protein
LNKTRARELLGQGPHTQKLGTFSADPPPPCSIAA